MDSVKRNFAILFLILFALGAICILKSHDLAQHTIEFSEQSLIVFGGIVSLLSGYGLVKMMLKYME